MTLGRVRTVGIDRLLRRQRRTTLCATTAHPEIGHDSRSSRPSATPTTVAPSIDVPVRRAAHVASRSDCVERPEHEFAGQTSCRRNVPGLLGRHASHIARFALVVVGSYSCAVLPPLLAQEFIAPSELRELTVLCRDDRRRVTPNCTVALWTSAHVRTNGHYHTGGGQPVSKLGRSSSGPFRTSLTVNTGSTGVTSVWLKAHPIGQHETLLSCSYRGCRNLTFIVGHADLNRVYENSLWFHVGGNTTGHGGNSNNHWMTPNAANKFAQAVRLFNSTTSRQGKIAVNDMSLRYGGTFDINRNWRPPHHKHSRGTAVDVRANGGPGSIPVHLAQQFVRACQQKGASYAAVEGSGTQRHVHCNW